MEIGKVILATSGVYAASFVAGMIVSVASSGIQCQKTNASTHAAQGAIWAVYPTVVYGLTTYFSFLRRFATNTLKSLLGFSDEIAEVAAVGYLMMLISWIATVWNVSATEKAVCNPDAQEMTAFKQKLVAELKQKQEAEEKQADEKQNPIINTT